MIRVLIVAHYAAVRAGLRTLLEAAGDIAVVGDVSGAGEVRRELESALPDVIVLDAVWDDLAFLPALSEFDIALVTLANNAEAWTVLADQNLPGWGLLRKEANGLEIVGAVRAASSGLIALDRALSHLIAAEEPSSFGDTESMAAEPNDPLSPREREVLQLMTLGLPNKQIAARLSISLSTVKFHVASILAKMGASSRTEAVTLGIRRGDVSL